jgi:leucyl aminopeptidase
MTTPIAISFSETDLDALAGAEGKLAVIVTPDGKLDQSARRVNRLTKGALVRLAESDAWDKAKTGDCVYLGFPTGLTAEALLVVKLPRRVSVEEARRAGAELAKAKGKAALTVAAGAFHRAADMSFGLAMRAYEFTDHKTGDTSMGEGAVFLVSKPEEVSAEAAPMTAVAEGVFFTRDPVSYTHLTLPDEGRGV